MCINTHPIPRLRADEVSFLVGDAVWESPSPELVQWVLERTDGNPLLVRELVRHLVSERLLSRGPGGVDLRIDGCCGSRTTPAAVMSAVRERLGKLSEEELAVTQLLSLGPGMRPEILAKLGQFTSRHVDRLLRGLARLGIIDFVGPERRPAVSHTLLRDAAYESICESERRVLHASVAEAWRSVEHELEQPGERDAALAWHMYYAEAYEGAYAHAVRAAAALADRARDDMSVRYLELLEAMCQMPAVRGRMAAEDLLSLAAAYWRIGRPSLCARAGQLAVSAIELRTDKPTPVAVEASWMIGRASGLSGDLSAAHRWLTRAVELARECGDPAVLAKAYSGLCLLLQMVGSFAEMDRIADESLALLEGCDRPDILSLCCNAKGNARLALCDWADAREWYAKAVDLAMASSDVGKACSDLSNLGLANLCLGDWQEAESCFDRCSELAQRFGRQYSMELMLFNSATLSLRRGAIGEAEQRLRVALAQASECGDDWGRAVVLSNLGELEHVRGDDWASLHSLAQAEDLMAQVGSVDDLPELYRRKSEALLGLGRIDEAREVLEEARQMAGEMGNRVEVGNCLRVRSQIEMSEGAAADAAASCGEALSVLEEIGAKYEIGQTLAAMGNALLDVPAVEEGVRQLEEARRVFLELGARRDVRAVQEKLAEAAGLACPAVRALPSGRERLASLYKSSRSLARAETVGTLLQELADIAAASVPAETVASVLLSPAERARTVLSSMCDRGTEDDGLASLVSHVLAPFSETLCESVGSDLHSADRAIAPLLRRRRIRRLLVVPLVSGQRRVGAIYLDFRKRDGEFSDQDRRFLEALAGQAATAIENVQLREELESEVEYLRWEIDGRCSFSDIIGQSLEMQRLFNLLERIARTNVTVLIEGESGTGKELVARAIHFNGPRKKHRFVAQNCAALPEQLLESELFGHVRGAFTGALREKAGLFEAADEGTFFLDEIADMPLSLQVKLLRVLQDGEVRRVGATDSTSVDVRIIAATNKSLEQEVKAGRFREDLFYRLNVIRVTMPPLRERRDDIPLLAQHFLDKYSKGCEDPPPGFSDEAMELLVNYDWPGNVRELENEVQRAIALADPGKGIAPAALSERFRSVEVIVRPPRPGTRLSLKEMIDDVERRVILQVLRENNWNKSRTAQALGLSRQGLLKKIARFGLVRDDA